MTTLAKIQKYQIIKTCDMFPEQYDVTYGSKQVGYLRLRGGYFSVECPDACGELVYEAEPNGDGCFDDDERDYYIEKAMEAIIKWRERKKAIERR